MVWFGLALGFCVFALVESGARVDLHGIVFAWYAQSIPRIRKKKKKIPVSILENPDSGPGTPGWQGVLYKKQQLH